MTAVSLAPGRPRILALDSVRGAIMVLMAIDHVRVYAGVPAGGPTPGVFFTRWVTHFCAPGFVFLAGTAAYLYGRKLGDRDTLTRFLLLRGTWLVLLELTLLRLAWTFNVDYRHYLLAGVIWMLGWCMILLALLIRLPLRAVSAFGLSVVALHNLTDLIPHFADTAQHSAAASLWQLLYFGGAIGPLAVLYVIVPWIGVMALGYAFGNWFERSPAERRTRCLAWGVGAMLLFLVLRAFNLYGDPRPWNPERPLSFLAPNKYPASLLFLLMTLGPIVALLPLLERARGWWIDRLAVFGRVPLFYYLLHIPLIHGLALLVALVRSPQALSWLFGNHPVAPPEVPPGYRWSLGLLYLVFAVAVTLLYFPCKWFAGLKARRGDPWLRYL